MSILWYLLGALAAWGAFDLGRRAYHFFRDPVTGESIYNDPNIPKF